MTAAVVVADSAEAAALEVLEAAIRAAAGLRAAGDGGGQTWTN